MVTKLQSKAGRVLGLAFASFLVFTLLMSGAVLAQERHDAEQGKAVKDEFLAEAHAAAVELGAAFGLSADDAASLVDTLLFTAPNIEPGANMRWLMADLSATYGLEPRELFGFLQLYGTKLMTIGQDYGLVPARGARAAFGPGPADLAGSGPIGPRSRWQVAGEEWQYGSRGYRGMRPEHGLAYDPGTERPGMAHADDMRNWFQQMHEEFHMQDAGYRSGMREFALGAVRYDIETPDRMRPERMHFGDHPGGRMRGGQPDFMDEDGMDVSVEPLVGGFEPDMMGLEHNVAAMVPVVLDVVGSTIVESLAESTGVPEAEMEAMVVRALLAGLDAAMDEGLITQADAFDMLMLLTVADAMEQ